MGVLVQFLRWSDLDPAGRPFDAGEVRAAVERCVLRAVGDLPRQWGSTSEDALDIDEDEVKENAHVDSGDNLEEAIDRALLAEYGAWAAGWRWAASEPGGGGPVRGWCCARDSLLRKDDPGPQASVDRVLGALADWRGFLEEAARLFAELRKEDALLPDERMVEHAAARLLPLVLERTGAEDAWYSTFVRVLTWYLESAGHSPEKVAGAVHDVVDGRFLSWIQPDEATQGATFSALGRDVAGAIRAEVTSRDATAAWEHARANALLKPHLSPRFEPVRDDGHVRFIEQVDRARDPERANRMAVALDACRESAARGEPLTFARLAAWQAIVLGEPRVGFRVGDAFAKEGRERYPLEQNTQSRFEDALADANDETAPVAVRAARAYLDVCFYHPFPDGNARAARLVLDHILTREGLALHTADPVFVVGRSAEDGHGAWCFALVLDHLIGPANRRGL